ncbi:hypothetical protein FisN_18Hu118 [Fistulifera solaris]|jgi:hypothetical protein|uniref:RxLR effector protein n=1 Tax=Fistulifera solaris TaxID=1519565 RepID=A0A1Z5JVQ3_FISSO|nr:hypothetical protein FisN_18Hu118 [Fistulifera solaris]|eukprot:GAX17912.1 hypothetical protein FisN_18Hu118 [Fistulifera solaris]
MKLSQILLIAAVSSASAFTVVRPAGVSIVSLQATKAAKDHEEDLALTREVIAKFMSGDDESKEEEKKEEKEPVAAQDE